MTAPAKKKSPVIAVVLNAIPIIFGLGYLYIGAFPLFVVVLGLQLAAPFLLPSMGLEQLTVPLLFIVWIVSMFDVYQRAKKL